MSTLGTPTIPYGIRMSGGGQAPNLPVSEGLQAPGLAFQPPANSDAAQLADGLMRSLDLAGSLAGQLTAEQRRQDEEQRRLDEHAKEFDIAQANEHAATWLPTTLQSIEDGKVTPADDTGAQARQMVDAQIPDGVSEAYRQQAVARSLQHVTTALEADKSRRTMVAAKESLGTASFGLYSGLPAMGPAPDAGSPAAIEATPGQGTGTATPPNGPLSDGSHGAPITQVQIDAARANARKIAPRLTDEQIDQHLLLPAIRRAALLGDVQAVDQMRTFLPDTFAFEGEQASVQAQSHAAQGQARREKAATDYVNAALYPAINGAGDWQEPKKRIDGLLKTGAIDSTKAVTLLEAVNSQQREASKGLDALRRRQEAQRFKDATLSSAVQHVLDPSKGGGAAALRDEQFIQTDENGIDHTVTYTAKDQERDAGSVIADQIQKQGDDQIAAIGADTSTGPEYKQSAIGSVNETVFSAQNRTFSKAGVAYEPWVRLYSGALAGVDFDSIAKAAASGKQIQFDSRTVAAVDLWDRQAQVPAYRQSLVKDPTARRFLELQEFANKDMGMDRNTAMLMAAKSVSNPNSSLDRASNRIVESELTKAVNAAMPGLSDTGLAARMVEEKSRLLMEISGTSPEAAITKAAQIVKNQTISINGVPVSVAGMTVRPDMAEMATRTAKVYAREHNLPENSVTMIPYARDLWMVYDSAHERPVDEWYKDGRFTSAGLPKAFLIGLAKDEVYQRKTNPMKMDNIALRKRDAEVLHLPGLKGSQHNAPFPGQPGFPSPEQP